MKRIFLALCLDDISRSLLSGLGGTVPGARPVPNDQLHLTLRFIGEVDGSMVNDVKESLKTLSGPPVTISIKGVGHFPPRGKPRVLWAGIEPAGELLFLRNKLNHTLYQCGITPEKRKFHPHITLARLNNTSPGRVAQFLMLNHDLQLPPVTINQLTLFSSILSPKGAIHTVEEQYQLISTAK